MAALGQSRSPRNSMRLGSHAHTCQRRRQASSSSPLIRTVLWVGMHERVTRYSLDGLSTVMQRTGRLGAG